ncbi:hypothetical protein EG328_005367 [Venturia inaequalis]|uniref:Uncharacterized protein n=1 Tax=Venturia inaequalis TaxID=5025 RepID=A0A8H3UK77_VENIN|nr:hypothetical protein EG328_005367 [Venturia inaequalis]
MPNQTSPNDVDNARPATMSAPEIITSKLLALVVRALTIPLGITTIVFAAIDMSAEATPYLPFLISLVISLTYNMVDGCMIILERWKFPSPTIRTSSQQYQMMLGCRAGPRWRGLLDICTGIFLMVTSGGLTTYNDSLGQTMVAPAPAAAAADLGRARVAQYLGITVSMAHLWMCGMAVVECFLLHRADELGTRPAR